MSGIIKGFVKFMDKQAEISTIYLPWFLWIFYAMFLFGNIKEQGLWGFIGSSKEDFTIILVCTSIWLWGTIRWLKNKGIISKTKAIKNKNITFGNFLVLNIVSPIIVSLIIHSITGSSSITIFSIPILSFLTANIDIG